ncbi:MAG: hypothetical protein U0234_19575 [Sandaracinus sp.]
MTSPRLRLFCTALVLAVALACSSRVTAQTRRSSEGDAVPVFVLDEGRLGEMAPRVYAAGAAGALGDARVQSRGARHSAPLAPGGGAVIGFEVPLAHAFSVGGELSVWLWSLDASPTMRTGTSYAMELSVVPRFRNPWSSSTGSHFAIAFGFPVGPTLSLLDPGAGAGTLGTLGVQGGLGRGLHLGAMAELQAFPMRHVGVTFAVGYVHRFLWHSASDAGQPDVQIDWGQPMVRLGLTVAF